MTFSTVVCAVLVCKMVAARYVGVPTYEIPRNLGLWFNQRQSNQRANILPRFSGHVPFVHANPGITNQHGHHTGNRHVPHVQQTIVLANNVHIQNPSSLNRTGSGNEHVRVHNKVDLATNPSLAHTNTQQEVNAYLQNQNAAQSFHIHNRPFAGVDHKLTPDNVAMQNQGLPQRNGNQIHISFQGARNSPSSNVQTLAEGGNSPGRILVKSSGALNISHPKGMIKISRSHNGRSNVIVRTNTKNTTPQRVIPAELSKNIPTTDIPELEAEVTSKYTVVTEEIEHEAP
ncbi:hypothetical protein ACJMK2_025424 [Sinanodonta woodiana]|uniref:Uncharacterized protein n=1 Tax=Sinanodonta woodiana TaxID=1069815 RepID=A0ABD3XK31_SINWO